LKIVINVIFEIITVKFNTFKDYYYIRRCWASRFMHHMESWSSGSHESPHLFIIYYY